MAERHRVARAVLLCLPARGKLDSGNVSTADLVPQAVPGFGTSAYEDVHRSTLVSPHVYTRGLTPDCTAGMPAIVTQTPKSTFEFASLSKSAQPSAVFPPDMAVSSYFQAAHRLPGLGVATA